MILMILPCGHEPLKSHSTHSAHHTMRKLVLAPWENQCCVTTYNTPHGHMSPSVYSARVAVMKSTL